jgi:tRNA1Val (adenine37-N6)-methyltransferase
MDRPWIKPDETLDELFRGKLRILQKRHGYRISMDPILLAHFVSPLRGGKVIDLGTGSGIIPLILALRGDVGELVGIEIQEDLVNMAKRSVTINQQEDKVRILLGDYRKIDQIFPHESFHHVVSNPPYFSKGSGRESPRVRRAVSRHEMTGSAEDVVRAARHLLGTRGRLWLTYQPARLAYLVSLLRESGFEPKRLRMIHGRKDTPARMLLLETVLGGQEGLEILPPLVLYRHRNVYTEELEEIYRMI